jgi:hypothetical protein
MLIFILFFLSSSRIIISEEIECDIVYRYVKNFGIGVYAGKLFEPNSVFERTVGIPLHESVRGRNELENYLEAINSTHDRLALGSVLMINHVHRFEGMTKASNDTSVGGTGLLKFNNIDDYSYDVEYITTWTLFPGDQVFVDYGDDWFSNRKYTMHHPRTSLDRDVTHVDDVQNGFGRIPGCSSLLTKVEDNKLVANRDISKGDYIEVARALLIPILNPLFEAIHLREFLWWKNSSGFENLKSKNHYLYTTFTSSEIDPYNPFREYAVVMLGNGLLYSAAEDEKKKSNVEYDWWDLKMIGIVDDEFPHAVETKENDSFCNATASLEQQVSNDENVCTKFYRRTKHGSACSTRMMVSFVAKKNIKIGEELVVDLFVDKETGFRYPTKDFSDQCL